MTVLRINDKEIEIKVVQEFIEHCTQWSYMKDIILQ